MIPFQHPGKLKGYYSFSPLLEDEEGGGFFFFFFFFFFFACLLSYVLLTPMPPRSVPRCHAPRPSRHERRGEPGTWHPFSPVCPRGLSFAHFHGAVLRRWHAVGECTAGSAWGRAPPGGPWCPTRALAVHASDDHGVIIAGAGCPMAECPPPGSEGDRGERQPGPGSNDDGRPWRGGAGSRRCDAPLTRIAAGRGHLARGGRGHCDLLRHLPDRTRTNDAAPASHAGGRPRLRGAPRAGG